MRDHHEHIFVYGTLLPGQGNHRRIAEYVRSARPGTIRGILVDLGAFPALLPGDGRVRGIVLEVDGKALQITDFIEGCRTGREHSLYLREQVEVNLDEGGSVTAWSYYYSHPDHLRDQPCLRVDDVEGVPIHAWPAP